LGCDSSGAGKFFLGASSAYTGPEKNEALESIHRVVKVQWTWYGPEDETWEHDDAMRVEYPHIFEDF
jgi:hypothetical protein